LLGALPERLEIADVLSPESNPLGVLAYDVVRVVDTVGIPAVEVVGPVSVCPNRLLGPLRRLVLEASIDETQFARVWLAGNGMQTYLAKSHGFSRHAALNERSEQSAIGARIYYVKAIRSEETSDGRE
jgi:hypothetical protein